LRLNHRVVNPARDREALDQAIVRGSELLKQGKLDQAQRAFRAALEIDPDNAKVLALLGLTHFRANEFGEARPIYEDLVELAPTDASHRLNLGLVYLKLNDSTHAITALEASRALDPSQGRAVSYLGLAYARAGRYAEAYRSFLLAGQNELAIEIEVNLTQAERDGIHSQLGRTPAGPLPAVARTVSPGPAVSRTMTPPALPRTITPASGRTITPHLLPRALTPPPISTPTPPPDDGPGDPRTRSQPRTKPPIGPPGSKGRTLSREDLAVKAAAAVELVARFEMPKDADGDESAEITIERASDPDIVAVEPVKASVPEPDAPTTVEEQPLMTVSQQFVLPVVDSATPRPVDGQSMVSLAVAIAAPQATTASRTLSGGFAARPLSELATEDLVRPDDGSDPFEIGANGTLLVRVTERVLTRLEGVHITGGDLTYEVAMRRSRGHQTDERFDDGGTTLHAVSGSGYLIAMPGKRTFVAVTLDDDILYLREDLVFAFEGTLRWENGNVPGLRGKLHVVQFRGDGSLVVRLDRPLVRVKLPPQGLVFVDAERLAGWIGRVIPRAVVPPHGGPMGAMCVECTGEGIVLVEPALPTPAAQPVAEAPRATPPPPPPPPPPPDADATPAPPSELADFAASLQPDPSDEI
jgi:uncharacterized protein (AIM24 family)